MNTWRNVAHMSNLSIKLEQKRIWERGSLFSGLCMREEKGRKNKELPRLLSSIYEVPSVGIRRAKNESSYTRRGYAWVPKTRDFSKDSSEEFLEIKGFGFRKCPLDFLEFFLRSKR